MNAHNYIVFCPAGTMSSWKTIKSYYRGILCLKINCKGASLIELLVTIAIISIISYFIYDFVNGLHTFVGGTNYIEQQYKMQDVISSIRRMLKRLKKCLSLMKKIERIH